jgi:hypothetical protein
LASCGTLLYPERRGQPAGRLDPAVVILDGIGLLLFFVPGVIAFVVDFATGAIYLPPEYARGEPTADVELCTAPVAPSELTPQRIEAVVREKTGRTVNLQADDCVALPLRTLDEFTPEVLERLRADPGSAGAFFRAHQD